MSGSNGSKTLPGGLYQTVHEKMSLHSSVRAPIPFLAPLGALAALVPLASLAQPLGQDTVWVLDNLDPDYSTPPVRFLRVKRVPAGPPFGPAQCVLLLLPGGWSVEDRPIVFAFGGFEVDEALQELRRDGRPVEIHATPLRLLLYLLRNRDRVISKDELLDRVWPGAVVSEDALFSALKEIRHALGETGSKERTVVTLRGRGYRLIAPVEEHPAVADAPSEGQGASDFVGWGPVLGELQTALDDAEKGRGRIVLLAGEAGIGKTRTTEELADSSRSRGVPVHAAWCREDKAAPPTGYGCRSSAG